MLWTAKSFIPLRNTIALVAILTFPLGKILLMLQYICFMKAYLVRVANTWWVFYFPGQAIDFFINIQWRIQPVRLGGTISVIFGSQVSLRVHYCTRDEVYFTTLLWENSGRKNGLTSPMLFSELYKIVVNKVTFAGFRGERSPPWIRPWKYSHALSLEIASNHWHLTVRHLQSALYYKAGFNLRRQCRSDKLYASHHR